MSYYPEEVDDEETDTARAAREANARNPYLIKLKAKLAALQAEYIAKNYPPEE